MQPEIEAVKSRLEVQILGVNESELESGNEGMSHGRLLPWLQDTPEQDVWTSWEITFRDVVILDGENRPAAVYNLTTHNLKEPANYDSLKSLLLQVAGSS